MDQLRAGALSREIEKTLVNPFLFGLRPAEIQGPLAQLQHTSYTKEDILKLLSTINSRQGDELQLGKDSLEAAFEMSWPRLKDELDKLEKETSSKRPTPAKPHPALMLEELLEMTRALQRETYSRSNKDEAERNAFVELQSSLYRGLTTTIGRLAHQMESLNTEIASLKSPFLNVEGFRGLGSSLGSLVSGSSLLGKDVPSAKSTKQETNSSSSKKGGYGSGPVREET